MLPTHPVQLALDRLELSNASLAEAMGVDPSTLSKKLSRGRRWTQDDINAVLVFLRQHDPAVTYEDLFASEPVEAVS